MAPRRIHPLHVGTITRQIKKFQRTLGPATVDLPLICRYMKEPDKRIFVDTGGGDPATGPAEVIQKRQRLDNSERAEKNRGYEEIDA